MKKRPRIRFYNWKVKLLNREERTCTRVILSAMMADKYYAVNIKPWKTVKKNINNL